MKKGTIPMIFAILMTMSIVSAIDISVTKQPVEDTIITELQKDAKFNLIITNNGENESFEIYTLVSGVEIAPRSFTSIDKGETKTIPLSITLGERPRKNYDEYVFSFRIASQHSGYLEDNLKIDLARFKESFKVSTEDITVESDEAFITIENLENYTFDNLKIEASSSIVNHEQTFSLTPFEKKRIKMPLEMEKIRGMIAGTYLLTIRLSKDSVSEVYAENIRYLERSSTATKDEGAGFFVISRVIEKTNEGNTLAPVEITVNKDIISRLFTTFSKLPDSTERRGFQIVYTWRQELQPNERIRVVVNTNWLAPLIIALFIIASAIAIKIALTRDLQIRKQITFVKTKSGEFALKITLKAKSSSFVEKINIIDRLPPLAKLYEKFGQTAPARIDEKSRRIEWQMESLQPGEERELTYLIYSKIAPIGKYELPTAIAVYERNGKIHESQSNSVFFLGEQVIEKKENE